MSDTFEETERLKIKFLRAYERLLELGFISQAQFDDVADAIDRIDELSHEEFEQRLGKFKSLEQNE